MDRFEEGEVVVTLRQKVKRGGELAATFHMDYPDLATALREIADDLRSGRVEGIRVGGRQLTDQDIAALPR